MLASAVFFGCSSATKKNADLSGGQSESAGAGLQQFQIKAMVTENASGKENLLRLNVLLDGPTKMRLEASSQMGVYLASMVLKEGEFRYVLARDSRYGIGAAQSSTFQRLLGIALEPKWIFQILNQNLDTSRDWKCEADRSKCENTSKKLRAQWSKPEESTQRIQLRSEKVQIEMYVQRVANPSAKSPSQFSLEIPKGFQKD